MWPYLHRGHKNGRMGWLRSHYHRRVTVVEGTTPVVLSKTVGSPDSVHHVLKSWLPSGWMTIWSSVQRGHVSRTLVSIISPNVHGRRWEDPRGWRTEICLARVGRWRWSSTTPRRSVAVSIYNYLDRFVCGVTRWWLRWFRRRNRWWSAAPVRIIRSSDTNGNHSNIVLSLSSIHTESFCPVQWFSTEESHRWSSVFLRLLILFRINKPDQRSIVRGIDEIGFKRAFGECSIFHILSRVALRRGISIQLSSLLSIEFYKLIAVPFLAVYEEVLSHQHLFILIIVNLLLPPLVHPLFWFPESVPVELRVTRCRIFSSICTVSRCMFRLWRWSCGGRLLIEHLKYVGFYTWRGWKRGKSQIKCDPLLLGDMGMSVYCSRQLWHLIDEKYYGFSQKLLKTHTFMVCGRNNYCGSRGRHRASSGLLQWHVLTTTAGRTDSVSDIELICEHCRRFHCSMYVSNSRFTIGWRWFLF